MEEEERKKRMVEYLQRLRDEVLEEEAALLERAEGSQVVGSKRKDIAAGDKEEQWCYDRCLLDAAWTWVKGMTTTIGCAGVVSVSASCGRHCSLA